MKYTVKPTNRFLKDYKLMEKRNLDMSLLDDIIVMLAQGLPLPAMNRDHALTGNYAGHRECHIQPDSDQHHTIRASSYAQSTRRQYRREHCGIYCSQERHGIDCCQNSASSLKEAASNNAGFALVICKFKKSFSGNTFFKYRNPSCRLFLR